MRIARSFFEEKQVRASSPRAFGSKARGLKARNYFPRFVLYRRLILIVPLNVRWCMFQEFVGLVQGSNRPYGTIKYGIYTIKYRAYGTVPYCRVLHPPEGVLFPRTNSGQKLRATYFAAYCAVQLNTRIILFRVEGIVALGHCSHKNKKSNKRDPSL